MRAAREYHEETKHSRSVDRRPRAFKDYLGLEAIPLPDHVADTGAEALGAIAGAVSGRSVPNVASLARILRTAAGTRKTKEDRGEDHPFRTYASAGARYPIEIYVATGGIDGLVAGVYHWHPREHALRRLREGDPRPWLVRASGDHPAVVRAPVTLVLGGLPWRTMWNYGERGYRHVFWDAGTVTANVLALASGSGFETDIVLGFADPEVDALLGADGAIEWTVALIPLGSGEAVAPADRPPPPVSSEYLPLSAEMREFPHAEAAHAASALAGPEDARKWRVERARGEPSIDAPATMGVEAAVRRRGSARVLSREPIPGEVLERAIAVALAEAPGDWGDPLIRVFATIHAVDGYEPGAYHLKDGRLVLDRAGDFRERSTEMNLRQRLGGDAAVALYLMADLDEAASRLGERAYRAAQLEAGITCGRVILAAYAQRISANALTFFDDEIREFFETPLEPMLVVTLGRRGSLEGRL